jgi:glycosyltransferase involved in cell wall biosynthesis
MWQGQSVSVVFPVYNEEEGIVRAINDFLATGYVDEVLVIDNNSKDRSAELVCATPARLITEKHQGYGYALRRGLAEAKGELIVLAEPDGTFLGKDIVKLFVYVEDFDMVMGTRTTPQLIWNGANMGIFLRYGNWIVAKFQEFLFNTPSLSDCGCTMRLVRRTAAERLVRHLTVGGSHFLPEMVILGHLMKFRMIEVPVHYCSRLGKSKITGSFLKTLKVGFSMIGLIVRYRVASWCGHYSVLCRDFPEAGNALNQMCKEHRP